MKIINWTEHLKFYIANFMKNLKLKIIIPVLNEEDSILKVLKSIPEEFIENIIVVDNGSSDNTCNLVKGQNVELLQENKKGYGSACFKGVEYIKKSYPDTEIVVFLDGDYSDYPEEIVKIINPIMNEGYDLVIGARQNKKALTLQQRFGNWLATKLIKIFYNYSFEDLGPFRAIKFKKLLKLEMKDRDFGWTVEMQVKAVKNNLKIKEVPVSYRKRIGKSKISGTFKGTILAGYKIIYVIFRLLVWSQECRVGKIIENCE